ncbi:MAG: cell surface protein SprA [Saprospiraceae bacterium]|nr:cell surface protein SprA [Saprospiraceae bacterium]
MKSDSENTGQVTRFYIEEMAINSKIRLSLIVFGLCFYFSGTYANGITLPDPLEQLTTKSDTIPLKDRQGDFITDKTYNPFDIYPSDIKQSVEYDPETNTYIVYERIGDEFFRMPTYMTFEEYIQWRNEQQQKEYFEKLAGFEDEYDDNGTALIDPLSKINIEKNLTDRLFGGNDITIEPQGNIDLTFGLDYREDKNPNIDPFRQKQGPFMDFDMDIKMNVEGNIGDKMDLGFNYDTNASFDFDRKIKLAYDSEQFSEDDIIKKIEAGNVSLPLRGTLIQGAQSLFGLKTELQFGNLRLTGIASQQRSKQETQTIQNGATVQEFELRPDDYDENRHFFISHYHRNNFETALEDLPYIRNNLRVTNLEVWISDDRLDYQQNQTMIAAIADLGEPNPELFSNPDANYAIDEAMLPNIYKDENGNLLPENNTNELFQRLIDDEQTKRIERTQSNLNNVYKLTDPRDFTVYQGRKLSPSEYTFNEELGFVSLNVRLRQNQNLSVSYEYFYTLACDDIYKVGSTTDESIVPNTNRSGEVESPGVVYTKMLKNSVPTVKHPTWDLMMKNVYPLRTSNLSAVDFQFDIYYEDDRDGSLKKFLPEPDYRNLPLLNIFGLDKLNSRNDPQPDGIFDFVPGVTVVPQSSSIVFPVLEPFGRSLEQLIQDPEIAARYSFPELYDTTVTGAREMLVKNKFVMAGRVKSDISSEYSLGAWNIPQGSVRVTAGGQDLLEGQDFEVDYAIGRVRIINESLLQSGVPINVSYEDNSVFSLQQKTMLGLRAEYEVNENFYIGGTLMRLFERPFTEKVNIGDDPINNHVYGLDMDFSSELPWLTRAVDKLPFLSTNTPSNISFSAEVAALDPGHSGAINLNNDDGGVVSIDDFEGAVSGFPLNSQIQGGWVLASTPQTPDFPEAKEVNSLVSGANRARLAWYVFDQTILFGGNGSINSGNSYTRNIRQQELFRRDIPNGLTGNLLTFDLTYNPTQRGPYNFDDADGFPGYTAGADVDDQGNVILRNPEDRWAGIMRYMSNSDFEASNYQFIEFWMLNPYLQKPDNSGHNPEDDGFLTFHLGNVSEDILRDNLQFYENTLPVGDEPVPTRDKAFGRVSLGIPKNDGFDNEGQQEQDLGLDGLDDTAERIKFQEYIESFGTDPQALKNDPSGDNYVYFNDFELPDGFNQDDDILTRYSKFNNPQGNSPDLSDATAFVRGNSKPDKEDLNNNRSLDQGESFYEYKVPINQVVGMDGPEINVETNPFIRDVREVVNPQNAVVEKWYRFRIPIREGVPYNGIEGFRSIQFMRMIINGFTSQKTFRLAEFELVRNQWRKLPGKCNSPDGVFDAQLNVDAVGIEENDAKLPFNYVLPRGIKQERVFNTFSNVLQNEKSLSLIYDGIQQDCESSIYKLNELDLRLYKKLQMFVHAEKRDDDTEQESGDMALFLRLGKDFDRHYYEYQIPLTISSDSSLVDLREAERVWPIQNFLNFKLDWLIQAKKLRNVVGASYVDTFTVTNNLIENDYQALIDEYESINFEMFEDTVTREQVFMPKGHKISVVGNPNLGRIKGIQIGIRNIADDSPPAGYSGEVWVNELRLTGLQERGGVAGLARVDVQLADFGNVAASGNFSTIGWGALDQKVQDRSIETVKEFDVSTNLELGKILPNGWNLSVPFYAQYAKSVRTPEFDVYDLDIKVKDEYNLYKDSQAKQDSIRQRNQIMNTVKSFNFTNVRKQRGSSNPRQKDTSKASNKSGKNNQSQQQTSKPNKPRKPMPWDIENFSASYAFTQIEYSDAIISSEISKDYRFGLDYKFSTRAGYIQPFKNIKNKSLAFIKEINFNPIPNSFSVSSEINRFVSERTFRIPDTPIFKFDDRRFEWERRYDLTWNFWKGLKMTYSALNESYIDEIRQRGIADDPEARDFYNERGDNIGQRSRAEVKDYWQDNLKEGGRNTNFSHSANVNYTLPLKFIPYMDWVDVKGTYRTSYSWAAGPLIDIQDGENVGNIIQNSQNRSINANFNLEKLYNKSKYIKNLDRIGKPKSKSRTRTTRSGPGATRNDDNKVDAKSKSKKKDRQPGALEKLLVRPLFMFRSFQINYKEDFSTVIPGFTPAPKYIGLSEGFDAPGTGFVFGLQPNITFGDQNNWLFEAANKGWITNSTALNQEVIQTESQSIDAKLKLEPWNDFKINVDFKKSFRNTQQQDFKFIDKDGFSDFTQLANRNVGSFEMSYSALNTLFNPDIEALFDKFEFNRSVVSYRIDNVKPSGSHVVDGVEYAAGYGKQASQVLVPAFISAYTNADPNTVDLDLHGSVKKLSYIPRPNWDIRYDGLNKLPWFKDIFSSFSLTHGYTSMLRVNSFNSDVEFDPLAPYRDIKPNGNYYSRIEIPSIQITEQFNPIIGVKFKTKQDLNIDFEYKKSRTLDLSSIAAELLETKKTEYVFGFGYTIKDSKFLKKKKKPGRGRARDKSNDPDPNADPRRRGGSNVNSSRGSDMTFTLSFSILDDIAVVHELDFGVSEATRGGKTISFSPSVDYVLNENLTLRAFLEYAGSSPYVTNNYGFTSINGGVTMRMTLN